MFKKEKNGKANIISSKGAIILVFILVLIVLIIFLVFSRIRIEVINFKFSSQTQRHINKDYKVVIKLCVLKKIPILKINITKTKLEKMKIKEKLKNIDFKIIQNKNRFDKNVIKAIKKSNININKINLNLEIGTENATLTSVIVPAISTILAILLSRKIENPKNQLFIIQPVYINQNLINIVFSGIFEMKMIHIINIIYILNRKKGVNKHERTSNRRSYDYSYE